MQLALAFDAPPVPARDLEREDRTCVCCGADWLLDDATIYGCDIHRGEGEQYLTWRACCEEQADAVSRWGFTEAYGVSLERVLVLIDPTLEIVEVLEEGDGTIVARLAIFDPTVRTGHRECVSRPGWFTEVSADVERHHRHHDAPQGHKFSIAVYNGGVRVGVAIVGRPVSRIVQAREPGTLEVTRVATWGHPALRRNASSKLYAAACERAAQLGYDKLITSILAEEENGASLRASNFVVVSVGKGGSWNRANRQREDKAPTGRKVVYARGLTKQARSAVASQAIVHALFGSMLFSA
jgi:hypothetical protein